MKIWRGNICTLKKKIISLCIVQIGNICLDLSILSSTSFSETMKGRLDIENANMNKIPNARGNEETEQESGTDNRPGRRQAEKVLCR